MGRTSLLSFFFTFLTLFHGFSTQQWPNECQLDQLNALEPSQIIKSEGGRIQVWDHHAPQLRCSGFAFERFVIEPQGLYLPTFLNAGKLTLVVHGHGLMDMVCSRTEHLVESASTGERFLVKCYVQGYPTETKPVEFKYMIRRFMVFREEETTLGRYMCYTEDIGDVCIFLSKSEAFCLQASSCPGLKPNSIYFVGKGFGVYCLADNKTVRSFKVPSSSALYWLPPSCIKNSITCGSTPTTKKTITIQQHGATVGALKAKKKADSVKTENWSSSDASVNNKPAASFSYLRRTIGVIRKSLTSVSVRTRWTEGGKMTEEKHGDDLQVPSSLID